jgi:hypothetical protein
MREKIARSTPGIPQPHPVVEADRRRRELSILADVAALSGYLADDLTYVHTTGVTDTKRTMLDRIESRDLTYHRIELGPHSLSEFGAVVWIDGFADTEVISSGVHKDFTCRFVQLWIRREERWQLRYWQSTIVKPPTPAGYEAPPEPEESRRK